jgi:hypothetical protein
MKNFRLTTVTALVLTLGAAAHAAPVTTSTTSFDGFANGSVNGQGGWGVSNPAFNQQVVDLGGGNKALRIANTVTSGSFGDQTFAPRPGGSPTNPAVDPVNGSPGFFAGESSTGATYNRFIGSFDFRSVLGTVDAGARITVSPDNGEGGRQGFVALESTAAGVTVSTFAVDAAGGFVAQPTLATVAFAEWNTLRYEIDFLDGDNNDVARIYLNNSLVSTINSWENFYDAFQSAIHPNGVPVQSILFRLSGAAATAAQGFYIDNVVVQLDSLGGGTVPLPGSLALAGLGLLAAGALRRRR